jgi:hypothetical protein
MGFFDDELEDLFNDWERRMRDAKNKMRKEGDMDGLFNMLNFNTRMEGLNDFSKLDELGEPDTIEEIEESGVKFIKKTWHTEDGDYVLMESVQSYNGSDIEEVLKTMKNGPFKKRELSLEEELEEAIEDEEYEKAAELRDRIAQKKVDDKLFSDKKNSKLK